MNVTCPNCQMESAYFVIIDEDGAHYECPDCDHEWIDDSEQIDDSEE